MSRLAEQLGWAIRQSASRRGGPRLPAQRGQLVLLPPAGEPAAHGAGQRAVVGAALLQPRVHGGVAGIAGGHGGRARDWRGRAAVGGRSTPAGCSSAPSSTARIASNYFAQVAAGLLGADERLIEGRVPRGDPAAPSWAAASCRCPPRRPSRRTGRVAPRGQTGRRRGPLRTIEVPDRRAHVRPQAPEAARGGAARRHPLVRRASAAADLGSARRRRRPTRASRAFVEDLLRRGRVDTRGLGRHAMSAPRTGRSTHALVREGRRVRLVRRRIHARP
ncbi:MAG: hypothetical protein MZV64_28140 [Ignavibacteriales bacterium]|nr:hypothetical protein [Ignavibacteriales bacterium]